jgi:hypothetical protein
LDRISQFCNQYGALPEYVDSSESFDWYKPVGLEGDITRHYFEAECDDFTFQTVLPIDFHHRHQWKDYTELQYDQLGQLVRRYFTPTAEIKGLVSDMESRYQITDYENICLLFYRGNDKVIETKLCGYDEFVFKPTKNLIRSADSHSSWSMTDKEINPSPEEIGRAHV